MIDNAVHCVGKLLSVRDSTRVGRDIRLIAGFELVVVNIEWNVKVVSNADDSWNMMELNNEVAKILLVRLLNVEHEERRFCQLLLNVCMTQRVDSLVVYDVNKYFVACMVTTALNEYKH